MQIRGIVNHRDKYLTRSGTWQFVFLRVTGGGRAQHTAGPVPAGENFDSRLSSPEADVIKLTGQ